PGFLLPGGPARHEIRRQAEPGGPRARSQGRDQLSDVAGVAGSLDPEWSPPLLWRPCRRGERRGQRAGRRPRRAELQCAERASRGQGLTVRGERNLYDGARVRLERGEVQASGRLPELRRPVEAPAGQGLAVGGEGQRPDWTAVTLQPA